MTGLTLIGTFPLHNDSHVCNNIFNHNNYDYYLLIGPNHTAFLKQVLKDIKEVTGWYSLGIQLEIGTSYLDHIEKNHSGDTERCKIEVIKLWLRNDQEPTMKKLAQAVEDMGGHANVVQTLRANHEGL